MMYIINIKKENDILNRNSFKKVVDLEAKYKELQKDVGNMVKKVNEIETSHSEIHRNK